MRLRRWRVVASVRVFPGSWRRRSLPAAAVFLFVSVAPAVHGVGLVRCGVLSFLAPAVSVGGSGSFRCRFVCGARLLRLRCAHDACRCSARSVSLRRRSAPARTIGDHLRSHSAGRAVLLRTLDGSPRSSRSVVAAERSSVFRATLSSSLIVGAHSPGVVLPGQRASSTGVRLPPARRTGSTPTA